MTDLRGQSLRRFGELLRGVCEIAGLTQGKLSREAIVERQRLLVCGEIHPEDFVGSMGQPTLSRVMAGLQEPTYFQVFIWLRVLKAHYSSKQLVQTCQELGIATPTFSADRERTLWKLSCFLPPDELALVYKQNQNEKLLDASPSLIDHKEERMQKQPDWECRCGGSLSDKQKYPYLSYVESKKASVLGRTRPWSNASFALIEHHAG